ncbi:DMT family transporter [Roseococcus sp. SDR]|uniref:DMT family transporter n=1 Tax=Roseococcus sp. SDR TaxID=2835532 RepID=UPI001BCB02E5|nr:DMT family transporter [Roseococcus sp. SDR]MBS7791160.1 DMT family transporter [Roseococcus sp. SDR]MBV1846474.1 DMT family transporter [Roseococcus sp. SDR]
MAGVLLQLSALMIFVVMDTMLKLMTAEFPVLQIIWARFIFSTVTVAIALRIAMGRFPWRSRAPGLQALRSLLLGACSLLFTASVARIPLADATAVGFASPLITVALAALLLGEWVSLRRWFGVALGFIGVLVAVRPPFLTGAPLDWAYLLPLGTATMFAFYQILTRRLAALDDSRVTIFHTGLAAALATSLAQPFVFIAPGAVEWSVLIAIGMLGALSHGLLVLAYARAPASLLAPLSYTQLIWASCAGILVFGDWPDGITLLGAVIIAAGGVLTALPQRPPQGPARPETHTGHAT